MTKSTENKQGNSKSLYADLIDRILNPELYLNTTCTYQLSQISLLFFTAHSHDIDVNYNHGKGWLLIHAVRTQNTQLIHAMLKKKADPNVTFELCGSTSLHFAIQSYYFTAINILHLQLRIEVLKTIQTLPFPVLIRLLSPQQIEEIQLIQTLQCSPLQCISILESHIAHLKNKLDTNFKIITLLLTHDANLNKTDFDDLTPLEWLNQKIDSLQKNNDYDQSLSVNTITLLKHLMKDILQIRDNHKYLKAIMRQDQEQMKKYVHQKTIIYYFSSTGTIQITVNPYEIAEANNLSKKYSKMVADIIINYMKQHSPSTLQKIKQIASNGNDLTIPSTQTLSSLPQSQNTSSPQLLLNKFNALSLKEQKSSDDKRMPRKSAFKNTSTKIRIIA